MPGCRTWQEVQGAGAGLLLNRDSPQARGIVCAGWTANRARDLSSYRNHATSNNAAFKATERGLALSSAAGSELVEDSSGAGLGVGVADPWSISFWHYTRAYVSLSQVWGFGRSLPAGDFGDTPGNKRYVLQFNSNYYFWGENADLDTGIAWDVGSWRFIEFVSDGANLYFYRDGVQRASAAVPYAAASGALISAFSEHVSAVSSPNMLLVDPRIYNIGHSAAEVAAIYRNPHDLYWRKSRSAPKYVAAAPASAVGHYYRTHLMARRRAS